MRLREKALKGDAKALAKYIDLAKEQAFEDGARQGERRLSRTEADILERFVASVRSETSPIEDHPTDPEHEAEMGQDV